MAYAKFKEEAYALLKGINSKASVYLNGPLEFRDLKNMHFTEPGALNKRPGVSLYTGATVSDQVSFVQEFTRLNGASFVFTQANTNLYVNSATNFLSINTSFISSESFIIDAEPFLDYLWMANGERWIYSDGSNVFNWVLDNSPNPGSITTSSINVTLGFTGTVSFRLATYDNRTGARQVCSSEAVTLQIGTTPLLVGIYDIDATSTNLNAVFVYATNDQGTDYFGMTAYIRSTTGVGSSLVSAVSRDGFNELDPCRDTSFTTANSQAPKYLEIYNNQMFSAGYTSIQSTFVWSDIAQPQIIQPESNAEVRTNDGDRITGMRSYANSLLIFKSRTFHRLSGDDPTNFLLQEVSDQYGCLSNRATVVFEDYMWFLDRKGICQYDGANVTIISNPVEPIFKRLNVSAAERAIAIHKKEDNEVWFAIPVDDSTINNIIVVYDYFLQAWTTYESNEINAAALAIVRGHLDQFSVVYGGYTGLVGFYDDDRFADIEAEIECVARGPFFVPGGKTQEKQFRRWYTDVNTVTGLTQPIGLKLYSNYDYSTLIIGRTFFQSQFQTRIDFGIPARSLAGEINHSSASLPFTMNGYAITWRLQRDV